MKVHAPPVHSPAVEQILTTEHDLSKSPSSRHAAIDVTAVYAEHGDFLWRSLQHLGVREADLEDVLQEVLVVVHRRGHTYDFECRLTTWLFGICLRVASRHRRRAYFRWERPTDELPDSIDKDTPEQRLIELRAKARLERMLAALSPEHRAAFVMFEIEGHSCQEIAELFGVPIGTIHSRLSNARTRVHRALQREQAMPPKGRLP